ncbi:MAG: UvrD-helicase domain-containing protein [Clostridia bacterium]|nr:UvrD-helicase domain-containing protein [Clostridia bacterium]
MSATPEQIRAIKARGEVLVSASAGVGKTTVMISRLADILEEGASLDNVLAVTFTKKAAAQMKDKLRGELIKRLSGAEGERRENIRVQLGKINTADISTIHSFCARLIRTYFYVLKVDASFEVLTDGAEAATLRARAMDDVFDRLYAEKSADLYTLLETLRKKRSDKALREILLKAYDEVRQRPDYTAVLDGACDGTYSDGGFDGVCKEYGGYLAEKYSALLCAIDGFADSFQPVVNRAGYMKVLGEMRDTLKELIAAKTVFGAPARLAVSAKPRVKPEVAEDDAAFASFCDNVKKKYKSLGKDLESEEVERERFIKSGAIARAFVRVLKAFDEAYSGVKRDEGKLDYCDLEHCALSLLFGSECDEDVREGVREKYKFVFVDEYQDVNPIQDAIISAVAGGDVFCVGDLKQAIYGFRGSSSRFFADKCAGMNGEGRHYVVLPDNFRSSGAVIGFVNTLFSRVMKPPVCAFDYAQGHAMRGGSRYAEGFGGVAEVSLFEGEATEKPEAKGVYSVTAGVGEAESITAEGLAVLQLVEEALKSEYYDPDKGCSVKVEAGDICVLTRKNANRSAQGIVRALSAKYPVAGAAEANICDRPEIKRLLDILSYLDNGEQDIPLAAALLSPLGKLTESELAAIRLFGGTGRDAPLFRECVAAYVERGGGIIAEKLSAFLWRVERLRVIAGSLGAARLIDEILCVDGFAATFDTESKLAAVRRLQREARSQSGELYLSAFLAKVRAGGFKITAPASLASDCIRVMTMHASKGLEFPVVIVADIAVGFAGDDRCEMPFVDGYGFAPRYYSGKDRVCRGTVLRSLYKIRKECEELSNEINLFYVACTRAKYALHVLTSKAEGYDAVSAAFAGCYADLFDVKSFNPRILAVQPHSEENAAGVKRIIDGSRADENMLALLREISEYRYPFVANVGLPGKSSASRIMSQLGEEDGNAQPMFDDEMMSGAGTGADEGIAYHRFLELCDFTAKDGAGIVRQLDEWERNGLITSAMRGLLKVDELEAILATPAFASLEGRQLYREREFVCRIPSAEYLTLKGDADVDGFAEEEGDGVIVQGAIDLLIIERRDGAAVGAHIVDYKYTAHSDGYIKQKYAPQLALYRSVVSKIYGLNEELIKTTVINIRACRQIDML